MPHSRWLLCILLVAKSGNGILVNRGNPFFKTIVFFGQSTILLLQLFVLFDNDSCILHSLIVERFAQFQYAP